MNYYLTKKDYPYKKKVFHNSNNIIFYNTDLNWYSILPISETKITILVVEIYENGEEILKLMCGTSYWDIEFQKRTLNLERIFAIYN